MKLEENIYQHKCLTCGKLFSAKGKFAFECEDCEVKRIGDEKFLSISPPEDRIVKIVMENSPCEHQKVGLLDRINKLTKTEFIIEECIRCHNRFSYYKEMEIKDEWRIE